MATPTAESLHITISDKLKKAIYIFMKFKRKFLFYIINLINKILYLFIHSIKMKYFYNYFDSQYLLIVKVDKPVEKFHVLPILSIWLNNDFHHFPNFFENYFCFEGS